MATIDISDFGCPIQIPLLGEFARTGICFLHHRGEIVYVGKAENIRKRIGQHIYEAKKTFDAVSCIPCAMSELLNLERRYIIRLKPKYNNCGLAKRLRIPSEAFLADNQGRKPRRRRLQA